MGDTLRILLVEDSEADAQLLLFELQQGGYDPIFRRVETSHAMSRELDEQTWDIILCDYSMPEFDGLAALRLLKAKGIDLPFIIVSGQIGEDIAVLAMKTGASDYLMKDNLARLVPAVERELREAEVRRSRRRAEQERDQLMEQLRNVNEQLLLSSMRIQEQSAELEATISALAEVVVVCGPGGEIVKANPTAAELLNLPPLERAGPAMEQLARLRMETTDGKPFPLQDQPLARALRGETVRGERALIYRPSDARPVWVSMSAAPICTHEGKPSGAVAIFTDITALYAQYGAAGLGD